MTGSDAQRASSIDLMRWATWAAGKAGEDWIRERELTHQQAFTLGYLVRFPGSIQRDIADTTRTTPANVSLLLQGLERRGLVERRTEPGDERSKRVHATPAGEEVIAGWEVAMREATDSILAPLAAEERETLHALLVKLSDGLPPLTR
ncbi:MarR family winged helix-turn-helix transcriptional regulator [uncultured Amnibacterium sp.]|uniref:MarR family winged helix-turn-helix transcriptional regulator n=1 Tax=uncultured Amnibacterium sp. TaxID=1631851 RepID=UPI0035CB7752